MKVNKIMKIGLCLGVLIFIMTSSISTAAVLQPITSPSANDSENNVDSESQNGDDDDNKFLPWNWRILNFVNKLKDIFS